MSFDADDEILQDFLIEAGEILEHLSEQLVELENRPGDKPLLNAIFRGFHTVKGGAGFLQLDPLVEICHVAENVFDLLRNDKRAVTSELMDVILQALDTVNVMFGQVQAHEAPQPADPALLQALHRLTQDAPAAPVPPPAEPEPATVAPVVEAAPEPVVINKEEPTASDDFSDADFESLVAALQDETEAPVSTPAPAPAEAAPQLSDDFFDIDSGDASSGDGDEITEAEFEALLDKLQGGKPKEPKAPAADAVATDFTAAVAEEKASDHGSSDAPKTSAGDLITDDEFEALLDQLHGSGKAPVEPVAHVAPTAAAPVVAHEPVPVKAPVAAAPVQAAAPAVQASAAAPVPAVPKSEPAHAPAGDNAQETTVRVDTKRLDDIMNMVGELVLVRNRLVRLGLNNIDEEISKAVANLDVVTADLQMAVMKTRMQPIKKVFGRFPRVVRDLARNLKKEVELELVGEETDLDKNLVEALADPLVHLVRNAVDHGIEAPSVREGKGKGRQGRIVLSAQQEGDHIVLSISDDGAGMDPNHLRKKAVEKGLMDEDTAARLSDVEAFNLIFHPGFSTKDEISDVSGRGVGMDVVKTKISQLNGSIDVRSERDKGSVIAIKVPLTLAIMPTLMIMLGKQAFALPLVSVNEIFHMDVSKKNIVDGQDVIIVREKALPLFYLKRWLVRGVNGAASDNAHVVIVTVGTKKVGFVVDQLIGQEEVVIKPLGTKLQGTPGIAGATITGDGRIALILDVPSMLKHYANRI